MWGIFSNKTNWSFLLFLVLVTQGNLMIKPLGIFFIILSSPRLPLKIEWSSMGMFYLLMSVFSFLSVFTLLWDFNVSYLLLIALGVSFWVIALVIFQYLNYFVRETSLGQIHATLIAYFAVNTLFCLIQLTELIIIFDLSNPFANQSSGDKMMGFFANSSINLIVNSFFIFYFFFKKEYKLAVIASVLCLMTTYMSGILILFLVAGYFFMTSSKVRWIHRFSVILAGIVFLFGIWLTSRSNVIYASDILRSVGKASQPRKVTSFVQTWEFLTSSPVHFLVGAGVGNFSSRLAFMADGEYVPWYPREHLYRSKNFTDNHYSLWNANLIFDRNERGTSNQPFSVYNQIFGEYGVLGFIIFLLFYFSMPFKYYKEMTYGRILLILMLGYFVLDYWFEFFSITVILELMLLTDIKSAKQAAI